MKTKVLMVYPEIPETFWSFTHSLKFTGKRAAFPPLSLLTVAALMPERFDIKVVDMNVRRLSSKDIENADMVFTSSMLVQKESLERVIRRCNELGKPVVAGGPYPTSSYRTIEGVDHFVLNEAEATLEPFLEDWKAGRAKKVYTSDAKPDISLTPKPRYDLIDMGLYSSMVLQYSRGCPFNCEFCEIVELFGRVPRAKGTEQFIGEVEGLYDLGYRGNIFIVDDNFIGNKSKVKELLRGLAAWQERHGRPFRFFTEASIDLAKDEELLDLMLRSDFTMAFVGIESPVEASLELARKKQNVGISLVESVHRIQEKGIEVTGGFIIGFDTDPDDIADRQIEFIRESGISTAMMGILTALPNTQLYRRLEAEGRILGSSTGNNTHSMELNFKPKMESARLIASYVKVLKSIYSPKAYFERCLSLLRRLPAKCSATRGFPDIGTALSNIRALFLSLFKQTFSTYGIRYLSFLGGVIREKPRLFPKAVEMAIFGHHFFKITRTHIGKSWRLMEKERRSFEKAAVRILRLSEHAPPAGFRALMAQLAKLRLALARLAGLNGSSASILVDVDATLSGLAKTAGVFIAVRTRRLRDLIGASGGMSRRSFDKTIRRYRGVFSSAASRLSVSEPANRLIVSLVGSIDASVEDIMTQYGSRDMR